VPDSVGGRCLFADGPDGINAALARLPLYAAAKTVVSLVPGVGRSTFDLEGVADPHELEDVDFAILPGRFGVAENGAILGDGRGGEAPGRLLHRPAPGPGAAGRGNLDNVHQAYERLRFPGAGFGVFISGPSKTADIEQSLVIGAHGPRSLTVFCLGPRRRQRLGSQRRRGPRFNDE